MGYFVTGCSEIYEEQLICGEVKEVDEISYSKDRKRLVVR